MPKSSLISISEDGSLLAICSSKILKLWDPASGILEQEFHPSEYLSSSITCLQFAPKLKTHTKNLDTTSEQPSAVIIALGTLNGQILIYSLAKQKVKGRFNHVENSAVKSLCWPSPFTLVSLGGNKLIAWGRNNEKLWELLYKGQSICALSENQFVIGTTSLHFLKYYASKAPINYVIPAHKTSIINLVPLFLNNEKRASYVLSAASSDRFVYAWHTSGERKDPVSSFMVGDAVKAISCTSIADQEVGIAVTTHIGILRYFYNHINGSSNMRPVEHRAVLTIKPSSKKKKLNSLIPILSARFISSSEILVAYGSELFPRCERVSVSILVGDVFLVREDPALFPEIKKSTLVKTVTPHVPESAIHLTPSHIKISELEVSRKRKKDKESSAAMPMEKRLDDLSLSKTLSGVPEGRPLDSYVHLLIQALHSKDSLLMNSILSKGEDEQVINSTVKRLPLPHVVPFLQYLQQVIIGRGLKNLTCINWIKALLYHHTSLLSSVPKKKELLEPFYTMFAVRTASMIAVTKLQARISLLLMHVKSRHENATQSSTEEHLHSLLQYKDDSSDDEQLMRLEMEGGPSESEDIWDDWTENDDEEEKVSGPLVGPEKRAASKRKLEEDDYVSVSDSEEEADEEVSDEASAADDKEAKDNGQLNSEDDEDQLTSEGECDELPASEDDEQPASDDDHNEQAVSEDEANDQSSSEEEDEADDLSD